jgi:hypothetical protein
VSIHVISLVLRKRLAGPLEKLVAIKLADCANDDGSRVYPSVNTIAVETQTGERTVRRILSGFRERGLLAVVDQGGGRQKSTRYKFIMAAWRALPDVSPCEGPEGAEPGDNGAEISDEKTLPERQGIGETLPESALNPATQAPNPSGTVIRLSSREHSASDEAGAEAPSISSLVWKEALDLLRPHSTASEKNQRKLIGSWLKRTSSDADKEKLLGVVRGARRAGTADPESYITKAVNEAFPPPPDPKSFSPAKWGFIARAAIGRKEWDRRLGPPPGKRGCLIPADLVTPELISAVNGGSPCRN